MSEADDGDLALLGDAGSRSSSSRDSGVGCAVEDQPVPASPASDPAKPETLTRVLCGLVLPVYLPALLFQFGNAMLMPILPSYARRAFGASDAGVGVLVASFQLGNMLSDIPAGILVSRMPYQRSMQLGMLLVVLGAIGCALTPELYSLILLRTIMGIGFSVWNISRQVYVTRAVPLRMRGQTMSTFGGIMGIGKTIGPLAGGLIGEHLGYRWTLGCMAAVEVVTMLFVCAVTVCCRDRNVAAALGNKRTMTFRGVCGMFLLEKRTFLTAGTAGFLLMLLRNAREILLPLRGDDINLSQSLIGYVSTVSLGVDSALFPLAGYIMDKYGRKYAGMPAFFMLTVSIAIIPWMDSFAWLMGAGVVAGLGNGLAAGIVNTLGSDSAPEAAMGEFLGAWRFFSDAGSAAGPLVVGTMATAGGIIVSSMVTAGLGVVGLVVLGLCVKETLGEKVASPPPIQLQNLSSTASHDLKAESTCSEAHDDRHGLLPHDTDHHADGSDDAC